MAVRLLRRDVMFSVLIGASALGIVAILSRNLVPQGSNAPAVLAAEDLPVATRSTNGTVAYNKTYKKEVRADGSIFVSLSEYPHTPRDPRSLPGYVKGDWLINNLGAEPAIIAPYLETEANGADVEAPVIESLLTRDPETFEWLPLLAESYEQKPDKVTIDFKIRPEAAFSDGVAVTADDVVFTFNTMMDPKINDTRYKAQGGRIKSCTKIDDHTVEFVFKEPFFMALETCGAMGIIPKHIYTYDDPADFNNKTDRLVGSGQYVFEKANWQRGQKLVLTRNENYWGKKWGETGTFEKQVFVFIQNPQAAFQAFQSGDLDEFGPNPEQWTKFSNDPDFLKQYQVRKFDRPNSGYRYIGWNEKKEMFSDARTRKALTMLTDRPTMIKVILRDLAHPITGPFSFMTPQNDASLPVIPYDPRAAKKLLAEAGWKLNGENVLERNGVQFKFDLTIPAGSPTVQQVAENLKTTYGKAGIIVNITPFEWSVMVERLDERNYEACILGWTGGIEEDPYQIWHSDNIREKGSNFIAWNNPEADKLIEAGRKEMDETKRIEIWHRLHKVIYDDQPYTFLWIGTATAFVQKRFENIDPYKTGMNAGDWYVPAGQQKYK